MSRRGGTYHSRECVRKVTPAQRSEEVYRGKSSEERFREYRFGLINLTGVLRPQCSTFDKYSHGPLSVADWSTPVGAISGDENLHVPG